MKIIDSTNSNKTVYTKDNLVAKGGTDNQTINFPENQKYNILISVNGLKNPGQQVLDKTRTGVARGIVVVPEFPMVSSSSFVSPLLIVGTFIGTIVAIARYKFTSSRKFRSKEE
jgi:hypothetical protein